MADNARMAADSPWFLYLLECRNGSYYAGITPDLQARFQAHLRGTGAKYTRANPPVRLLASRAYPDRAAASRAEYALKQLPRGRKLAFLSAPESAPVSDSLQPTAESAVM
jgi:putative endonuclease